MEDPRRDVDDELGFHLEMRTRDLVAEGLDPDQARRQAMAEFGDLESTRRQLGDRAERHRRIHRLREWRDRALWDLKLVLRGLLRRPALPVVIVLTLAAGIGANTAIYSLVDALVFRPLPFGHGDRLVRMRDATERPDGQRWPYNSSPRSYQIMRESGIFESVTAQRYHLFNLTGDGDPASLVGIGVSRDWLRTLEMEPLLGRGFTTGEQAAGAESRVALVGFGLWQRRYGGSPEVVGRRITLNDQPYTVVGVMPRYFDFPYGAQVWVPDTFDPADARHGPNVAARLRDGETLASTQAALDDLSRRAAETYPDSHARIRLLAIPERDDLLGNQPRLGLILLGAVGFLLLIACANVANLLLVRSISRQRETALRNALGATRGDQVRLVLIESLVLAILGGGLGILAAWLLLDPMAALSIRPDASLGSFFRDLRLDWRALTFTGVATVGTALLVALLPALRGARAEPAASLGSARGAGGDTSGRLRGALVVAEVALSVVLLAGAGVLVGDFLRLRASDPGYDPSGRITATLVLPSSRFEDPPARVRFLDDIVRRVEALPGVEEVGYTSHLPVTDGSTTTPVVTEDGPASEAGSLVLANYRGVDADYLETMGARLVEGRGFTTVELRDARPGEVILNRSAADAYWPGESPLGRRVRLGTVEQESAWMQVVGVVDDMREEWELAETWYLPFGITRDERAYLVVRTSSGAGGLPARIREAIWAVDPDQPIERLASMDELVGEDMASERLGASAVGLFGLAGLVLAGLGVYGLISYSVSLRAREMGVRRALGAGRGRVVLQVLAEGGRLLAAGLMVGVAGAFVLTGFLGRIMVAQIPGRTELRSLAGGAHLDARVQFLVVGLLFLTGLLACLIPAWRAARVDPAGVLREP